MTDYPLPAPKPPGLNGEWYRRLAGGELRFQRCSECGTWRHPPRLLCAACGSEAWEWAESRRAGEIFSWTVSHQALHPAFAEVVPYVVAIVALDEGVRLVCSVRDLAPDDLALGLRVRIEIAGVDADTALPYARPA